MSKRTEEIDEIIGTFESLKKDSKYIGDQYAIEQDIAFMQAVKTFPRYISWLFGKARKIDSSRILEPTDFPIPDWDRKMHSQLIKLQRNKNVGLIKPLVDRILAFIDSEHRDIVMADLGAGGMEIERQVAEVLLEKNNGFLTVLVGIDKSPITQEIAMENLRSLRGLKIYSVDRLDKETLEKIKMSEKKGVVVVLCKNNIFDLENVFSDKYFDLMYHSLFKHHLTTQEQEQLDGIIAAVSKNSFEYDGYQLWPVIPLQTMTSWKYPIFLSDTILSFLRYKKRKDIKAGSNKLSFFKMTGHYLLERNK